MIFSPLNSTETLNPPTKDIQLEGRGIYGAFVEFET